MKFEIIRAGGGCVLTKKYKNSEWVRICPVGFCKYSPCPFKCQAFAHDSHTKELQLFTARKSRIVIEGVE